MNDKSTDVVSIHAYVYTIQFAQCVHSINKAFDENNKTGRMEHFGK